MPARHALSGAAARPGGCPRVLPSLLLALPLWLLGSTAHAVQSIPEARAYLGRIEALQARFELLVLDETGEQLDHNSGMLHMLRPGRLRWEIAAPYPHLLLVDGARVWNYDQELGQITVRELDEEVLRTPVGLLLEPTRLEADFQVDGDRQDADGRYWLMFSPRGEASRIRKLEIGFYRGVLEQLRMWDHFGQLTGLQFSDVKEEPPPDPALFQFTPPPGVEVLDGLHD